MSSARYAAALALGAALTAAGAPPAGVAAFTGVGQRASVSGVIVTADGRPLSTGAVMLIPVESGATPFSSDGVTITPDGRFTFPDVAPGRYEIRARGDIAGQATSVCASVPLTVDGHDISYLRIVLAPAGSVEGTLALEGPSPVRPLIVPGVRVRVPFSDGSSFGDTPTGDVQRDGSFRIRGIMPGPHLVAVEGLPEPWMLKSVTYRGQEIADLPLDLRQGEHVQGLRVTVSELAGEVSGVVRDRRGAPAVDATVVVVAASPQFWTRASRRLRVARTDVEGRYRVRGLPAGDYRAAALPDIDAAAVYREDVLRRATGSGTPLSLADGEVRTLDLTLFANEPTGR